MRDAWNTLSTLTYSFGPWQQVRMPGPNEGIVAIPAASNQGASVAPGKTDNGGDAPRTSRAADWAATTSGCALLISAGGTHVSPGSKTISASRSGSTAR